MDAERFDDAGHQTRIAGSRRGILISIANAEATAEIEKLQGDAEFAEFADKTCQSVERFLKRLHRRDLGTDVTVETCPHYLEFEESDMERLGPALKCAPPIRDARNRDGLWRALLDGKQGLVEEEEVAACCPVGGAPGGGRGVGVNHR